MTLQEAEKLAVDALGDLSKLAGSVASELSGEIAALASDVLDTLTKGGRLMFCGNGGSAADAQHLAAEYVIRFRKQREGLPALALTTDTSILTAGGNDLGFESVFERQVQAHGRPGDLLILHSTSGDSENLLRAADVALDLSPRPANEEADTEH